MKSGSAVGSDSISLLSFVVNAWVLKYAAECSTMSLACERSPVCLGWLTQNAMHFFFFNGSQHCWLLNAARYTKADGVFLSYGLNISAVCWTQPGCICGKCRGCSPTERRPLPPERHRKSEMVREEVVLVVQEEIVSALLLFRVLRDRDDRSVSVSIKLYQQVLTATIKENVQCW